jgi:hypothetical protein
MPFSTRVTSEASLSRLRLLGTLIHAGPSPHMASRRLGMSHPHPSSSMRDSATSFEFRPPVLRTTGGAFDTCSLVACWPEARRRTYLLCPRRVHTHSKFGGRLDMRRSRFSSWHPHRLHTAPAPCGHRVGTVKPSPNLCYPPPLICFWSPGMRS